MFAAECRCSSPSRADMEALLTSVKKWSLPGQLVGPLRVRVNQGPFRDRLFSASGGNNAAAIGALTNDYPEEVNCAVDSFASHAFGLVVRRCECGLTNSPGQDAYQY